MKNEDKRLKSRWMTMSESYTKFDPAEYFTTEEQIESYLAVAKEAKDPIIYEQAYEIAERAGKKLFSKNLEARVVLQNSKNDCGMGC